MESTPDRIETRDGQEFKVFVIPEHMPRKRSARTRYKMKDVDKKGNLFDGLPRLKAMRRRGL